jgi:hypothetical protein
MSEHHISILWICNLQARHCRCMLQNIYNIQVWCLARRSEDHSVRVQHLEVYMWQQQCTHLSLGTKWILCDEPADTRGHSGIHLEWVKGTGSYRIPCVCTMAYIGQTGCCIKTSTTDPSWISQLQLNMALTSIWSIRVSWPEKNCHINYINGDMIVELPVQSKAIWLTDWLTKNYQSNQTNNVTNQRKPNLNTPNQPTNQPKLNKPILTKPT